MNRAILYFFVLIFTATFAVAGDPTHITVIGKATRYEVPNQFDFSYKLFTRDDNMKHLAKRHAKVVEASVKATRTADPKAFVQTVHQMIRPEFNRRKNPPEHVDYSANTTLAVTVSSVESYEAIVQQLTALGVHAIDNVRYSLDNMDNAYADTLKDAFQNAKQKATTLATISGSTLGAVTTIKEITNGHHPYTKYASVRHSESGDTMSVEAHRIQIPAEVSVTFELLTTP